MVVGETSSSREATEQATGKKEGSLKMKQHDTHRIHVKEVIFLFHVYIYIYMIWYTLYGVCISWVVPLSSNSGKLKNLQTKHVKNAGGDWHPGWGDNPMQSMHKLMKLSWNLGVTFDCRSYI